MPEPTPNPEPVVYQLRVVLRGVSPLIWRRLLVRSDSTIADLHATFQLALGWSDEHLNRFVIHGREYGVWHDGGIGFRDDPRHVRLANLGLRVRERFLYEYDFTDGWDHDVRLEQILPLDPRRGYPICIGGRRAAPPEDCGGPWAFLELRQHYSVSRIAERACWNCSSPSRPALAKTATMSMSMSPPMMMTQPPLTIATKNSRTCCAG